MKLVNREKASGTGLQGYIGISYKDLLDKLGEPEGPTIDEKIRAHWTLEFEDGDIATIYDYKENIPLENVYTWHIGGHKKEITNKIKKLFQDYNVQ